MSPSLRLRALNVVMRRLVKPKLRRTATPDIAHRDFERAAPFLFSVPRGTRLDHSGPITSVTCGTPEPGRAILYVHGGAFFTGSARSYRAMAARLSKRCRVRVFLADYPLLQTAPFPAACDAVRRAWDDLRRQGWSADQIVVAGDSAGGNLAFGLLATLLEEGERPRAAVGFSPWADLTLSGHSIQANRQSDPLIPVSRMQEAVDLYLDGAAPSDPWASPVFSDFPDPPPVLIQAGAEEVLLSDAQRLAIKTKAQLTVWPGCPHVWQMFDPRLPEARSALREVADFVQTSFASDNR